jgi:nuclear transcription Y subunit beta
MKSKKGGYLLSPVGSPPSDNDSPAKEQDRFLPIANVSRIMKKSLPANAKISKEAKETVQECVSEFISFVTGEASDKCQREKRKTINGDDLLWAMTTLGFEAYVAPLKSYLNRYREAEGEKAAVLGGARHADGDDVGAHHHLAPTSGDGVGHDGRDVGGHDAHVGLMMGVGFDAAAGGSTSYYSTAAAGTAYGGDGSKLAEFDGEEENGGAHRGFAGGHRNGVQW